MDEQIRKFKKLFEEGYDESINGNEIDACDLWQQAWQEFLQIIEKEDITTLDEFDSKCYLEELVSDWIQEYVMTLRDAGIEDEKHYLVRINLIQQVFEKFGASIDALMKDDMQDSLAESIFITGERDKAEEMFRQWTNEQPKRVWSWIRWADCWLSNSDKGAVDLAKAETILNEGLIYADKMDKDAFYERLIDLYQEMGLNEKAQEFMQMAKRNIEAIQATNTVQFAPVRIGDKIGRNQSCPCGSGKKYKKCCGN